MKTPSRVGILGGGQLALMMAQACPKIGIHPVIFAEKKTDCAVKSGAELVLNDKSSEALTHFCRQVDFVTIENEFIDLNLLKDALGSTPLYPELECLSLVQNKLHQKTNLFKRNISSLDYVPVNSKKDLEIAEAKFGKRLVLKRARLGYDGRGTYIFDSRLFDPDEFWDCCGGDFEGYAEPLVSFEKELAVIVARTSQGMVSAYPVIETNQEGGICHWAVAPARVGQNVADEALKLAIEVINAFAGVGVFGIEMFLLDDGKIVVNEIAPRVHNSGHLTMDGCKVGQFEMHLRAVFGMELPAQKLLWPGVAMVNILGSRDAKPLNGKEEIPLKNKGSDLLGQNTWIHWYGKEGEAKGRKLGHINVAASSPEIALKRALAIREDIEI